MLDSIKHCKNDWTLVCLNFILESYGIELTFDQIDTPHADMCFGNITITHSVYLMDNTEYFKDLYESFPDYRKIF